MNDDWREMLEKILIGIDKCEDSGGWWETSTGAEFGARKKEEIIRLLSKEIERVREDRNKEIGDALRRVVSAHPENEMIIINDILNFAEHLHPTPPKG